MKAPWHWRQSRVIWSAIAVGAPIGLALGIWFGLRAD